ncbi:MAG: hypothetical protein ACSW8E_04400, partial [Clostridia bacterium]
MEQSMTRAEQSLRMLQSVIPGGEKLYVWCYRESGELVASSCPKEDEDLLDRAFRILGASERVLEHAGNLEQAAPFLIGSAIGMQWAVTYETERRRSLIFVVGPVFYAAPSERQLRPSLRPFTDSLEGGQWSSELIAALPRLPVIPYVVFTRYAVMVHNTLTGEQLGPEALSSPSLESEIHAPTAGARDREKVWLAERAMLQMVRNGAINYHAV